DHKESTFFRRYTAQSPMPTTPSFSGTYASTDVVDDKEPGVSLSLDGGERRVPGAVELAHGGGRRHLALVLGSVFRIGLVGRSEATGFAVGEELGDRAVVGGRVEAQLALGPAHPVRRQARGLQRLVPRPEPLDGCLARRRPDGRPLRGGRPEAVE